MKKMRGILFSIIVIIVIVVIAYFSVNNAKTTSDNGKLLEEKVDSEIKYLDNKILSILNNFNISDENNIGTLSSDEGTDWNKIITEMEEIYSSWNTIILDLYKLNVSSENILKFSSLLDIVTINIKNENKVESLRAISDLYSLLPIYMESYKGNTKDVNIQKIKASVMRAYSSVEGERWSDVNNEISNADNIYLSLLNGNSKEDNYDINKGYILLKELQNSLAQKNKEIFYIKYKNLMEKLNNF